MHIGDDMPAIGFKTLGGIVGVPTVNMTVNGDVVVVPESRQLAQPPCSRQRTGFVRNTFHHATVTHKHIGTMIDDFVIGLVEFGSQQLFCHSHTDCVGDTLSQRAACRFYASGITIFGMARCLGIHLTEAFQLFNRQIVA